MHDLLSKSRTYRDYKLVQQVEEEASMAKLRKVHLVSGNKKIRLTDRTLHWYRTGDRRSKTHIFQRPNPLLDLREVQSHSWTFCGMYVETSALNIEREIAEEVICRMCLGRLEREFQGSFEEVKP